MSTELDEDLKRDFFQEGWPHDEDKGFPAIKIRMNPVGRGRIWIDGVELKATRSVKFNAASSEATIVIIELFGSVDLETRVSEDNLTIVGGEPVEPD